MDHTQIAGLPDHYRFALAYAPAGLRPVFAGLFTLDHRLSQIVSQTSEPLLAQLRLAWWRDELAKSPEARAQGEPLLAAIGSAWGGEQPAVRALIDAWEELLAEPPLPAIAAENFAAGRAGAFAAIGRIARVTGGADEIMLAGRRWALADLAVNTSDIDEKAELVAAGLELGNVRPRLPRAMRPLLVLDGLARASLAAGGTPLMQGRRNLLAAMRLGLLGS